MKAESSEKHYLSRTNIRLCPNKLLLHKITLIAINCESQCPEGF